MHSKVVFVLFILILPSSVLADDQTRGFSFPASLKLTTNYLARGVSQTKRGPALQGRVDARHSSGFYAGLWASNVDFPDKSDAWMELDSFIGFTKALGHGVIVDMALVHYEYPGVDNALEYDFEDAILGVIVARKTFTFSTYYYYAPDYAGSKTDQSYHYFLNNFFIPLPEQFQLGGTFGHSEGEIFENPWGLPESYSHWQVTLSRPWLGVDWELAMSSANSQGQRWFTNRAKEGVSLSITKSFSLGENL
ncbi:MAG: hypothetical protein HQL52_17270 [Magnetococcales bacterium]|nr:hypothetical protein [Magnetococcales bacterium]